MLVAAEVAAAPHVGAFSEGVRHGDASLVSSTFSGGVAYDDDAVGGKAPGTLRLQGLAAALRMGLAPGITAMASVPFVIARADESGVTAIGLGDAMLGLQVGVYEDGPLAFAVRADVKVPLYVGAPSVRGRQPLRADVDVDSREAGPLPALGDGQLDVTVSGLFAATFPFGGFVTWETGYRARTGDVSDAVTGAGRFAVPVVDERFLASWNLLFVNSLDPAVDDNDVATDVVGRGFVSTGPALELGLPEVRAGLRLRVGSEFVFRGRNAAGGVNVMWGVACAF